MRILLAVDGSASSIQARDLVAALPWPEGTSLTVLTAYVLPSTWFADVSAGAGAWLDEADAALRAQVADELTRIAAPLHGHGWAVEEKVVRGRAADAVLSTADEMNADLIVLGSRGHGQIQSMLLGSVSAEVADRARQSVLVARGARVSQLLVATDGSAGSDPIPEVLGGLGVFRSLPAVALSVAPVDSPTFALLVGLYTQGSEELAPGRDGLREQHRGYALSLAERLTAAGIPAEAGVRDGDAAREITAEASERGADLIVTGSRSLRGLDRLLLGSVARNVLLHAHASVLIVRGPETPGDSGSRPASR